MRVVNLKDRTPHVLGTRGDNAAACIRVNVEAWRDAFPSGHGGIMFTSPEQDTYPLDATVNVYDGVHYLEAVITSAETQAAGWCVIRAAWYDGETLVFSAPFSAKIMDNEVAESDTSEAEPSWVADFIEEFGISREIIDGAREVIVSAADIVRRAEAAADCVEDAEAWAVGTRDGTAVGSDDPTYHNNSKYYAENVNTSLAAVAQYAATAESAKNSASADASLALAAKNTAVAAQTSAESARASAENARASAMRDASNAAASASDAYNSANAASTSAANAAMSAMDAAESASDANAAKVIARAAQSAAQIAQNAAETAAGAAAAEVVEDWLEANVDPSTGYVIDSSLTVTGAAADAGKVGDLKSAIDKDLYNDATPKSGWVKGVIVAASTAINSGNGVVSPKISNAHKIVLTDCQAGVRVYKNGVYLGAVKTGYAVNKQSGNWLMFTGEIDADYLYRVTDSDTIELGVMPTDSTTIDADAVNQYAVTHVLITKSDVITLNTKLGIDESIMDFEHGFINYGYDTPQKEAPVSGATDSTAFGYERNYQEIIFNGGPLSRAAVVKLNDTVQRTVNSSGISAWAATVLLEENKKYKFTLKHLSGTVTKTSDDVSSPTLSVYKSGTNTTAGVGGFVDDTEYVRTITGDGSLYNVAFYVHAGTTFFDAKYLVLAQEAGDDVSESVSKLSDSVEQLQYDVNTISGYIDYNYGTEKTVLPSTGTISSGSSVGVERYLTNVKLNYAGESGTNYHKRVRVTGAISRTAGGTTYKNWVGQLQLMEGKEYGVTLRKLSGTGTLDGNAYLPTISIYESNGASTIATTMNVTETEYTVKFTAPAGPINIAIFINVAAVLTDFDTDIKLFAWGANVNDYYINEVNDTISKARLENTHPSLVFLWATDIHRYSNNAAGVQNFSNMISNMRAVAEKVPCDFILNTGDLTDGNLTQVVTMERANNCLAEFRSLNLPYFWVLGNHDTNYFYTNQQYVFTMDQCFSAYFTANKNITYNVNEHGTDYYADFDWLGVRLIALNANNLNTSFKYCFGPTTATWLASALDTDKKVILCMHQSPIKTQVYDNVQTTGAADIVTAVQDFVDGGGNLIMLTGHSHLDLAFIDPWLSIMQDCQRFSSADGYVVTPQDSAEDRHSISGFIDTIVKPQRTQFTASEDSWTVCIYKPDIDELDLIRFGGGNDRYFHANPIAPTTLTTKLSGTVTWSSSDTSVATVSGGVVTGVGTGRCAVLAKDETGNYECWIIAVS